eukprot:6407559-Pyramimonas_sp.AAC.1
MWRAPPSPDDLRRRPPPPPPSLHGPRRAPSSLHLPSPPPPPSSYEPLPDAPPPPGRVHRLADGRIFSHILCLCIPLGSDLHALALASHGPPTLPCQRIERTSVDWAARVVRLM